MPIPVLDFGNHSQEQVGLVELADGIATNEPFIRTKDLGLAENQAEASNHTSAHLPRISRIPRPEFPEPTRAWGKDLLASRLRPKRSERSQSARLQPTWRSFAVFPAQDDVTPPPDN